MAVAVALAYLALSIVQEELRLILTGSLPTLLLSLLLSIVERRSPLVTFSHHCPLITVGRDVNVLLGHKSTLPSLPFCHIVGGGRCRLPPPNELVKSYAAPP